MKIKIYTDGGAKGNPGEAAVGAIAFDENNQIIFKISKRIGVATNNIAEYSAIIYSLKYLEENNIFPEEIDFYEDSMLIVNQLNGIYKINNEKLKELNYQIKKMINDLKLKTRFSYIPRSNNTYADKLVNLVFEIK